jgi:predicted DNA-binding protein (MmcQ/YjbR family)
MVSPSARKWEKARNYALGLPEAWEDHPWGETVAKVGKKVFVFLGLPDADAVRVCVKLTDSHHHAMSIQGAEPAGHGLGRSGWVLVPVGPVAADLLEDWVDESYRNVAPKRLIARLPQG